MWRTIAEIAQRTGTPVFLVGGSIRDHLLGIQDTDSDFLILGRAESCAKKVSLHLDGGKVVSFPKFGSAFFFYRDFKLEFTEPRVPESGRSRQEWVEADLRGRDFTINALAAELTQQDFLEIFDPTGGIADLKEKILRTPAAPEKILADDPLRTMRALRFAAKFNLKIEPQLWGAIVKTAPQLVQVSNERIGEELMKCLALPKPSKALLPMYELGIFNVILPEVEALAGVEKRGKYSHKDILRHSLKVLDNVAKNGGDEITRLAALLHDIAKPRTKRFDPKEGYTFHGHEDLGSRMVKQVAERLRLPKDKARLTSKLTLLHMRPVNLAGTEVSDSAIRRLMTQAGDDLEQLLVLCRADITSGNPRKVERYLKNFDYMVQRMGEVVEKDEMRTFQSPVRGEEIMEICGIAPGPLVGKIKTALEEAILEGKIPNEYEAAKEYFLSHKDEWLAEE